MKAWIQEIIRQVFQITEPRRGDLWLTKTAAKRMQEHKLTIEDVEDAFAYGKAKKDDPGLIMRKFPYKQVFIRVKQDEYRENTYMVITCWKIG